MVRSCSLLRRTTEKIFSHFKFLVFVFFQNATADFITKCDGLLLKNATSVITKCDRTTLQSRRVTQIWLHACGYVKDLHGAVEVSCTLITKGTERSNTLRLSYCSFTAEKTAVLLKITHTLWRYIYLYRHVSIQTFSSPEATRTENAQNVCHLFRCTDY